MPPEQGNYWLFGNRDNRIWTCGLLLPKQAFCQTELYPGMSALSWCASSKPTRDKKMNKEMIFWNTRFCKGTSWLYYDGVRWSEKTIFSPFLSVLIKRSRASERNRTFNLLITGEPRCQLRHRGLSQIMLSGSIPSITSPYRTFYCEHLRAIIWGFE